MSLDKLFFKKSLRVIKTPRTLLFLFLCGFLAVFFITPLKQIFNHLYLVESLQTHSCCTIPLFIFLYIVLTVLGIPGTVLTIVGGVIFGIWWGTLWTIIGATIGALGAFLVARYLFRDHLKSRFQHSKYWKKINHSLDKNSFLFVLAIRFAPVSPFNVVNFIFGLTPIHWFDYTLATFIGIIPGTFAYVWLGTSGIDVISGGNKLAFISALGFLTLLSIIPLLIRRKV